MRHFLLLVILVLCLASCRDKVICPAFQSAYILDDSVRMTYYSYLWKLDADERNRYLASKKETSTAVAQVDTTGISSPLDSGVVVASTNNAVDYFAYLEPRMDDPETVRKNKNGIIKSEPYWIKNYKLRTAPKENILTPPKPEEEDSAMVVDQGQFLASDFNDSTGNDEVVVIGGAAGSVDSTALLVDEDTSFVLPTLAKVEPAKPKTELQYRYRYDPNDKALNVEQAYYNKHFGQYLYRRVEVKPDEQAAAANDEETSDEESKGGFLKNLFGKKKKSKKEPTEDEEIIEDEPTVDDEVIEEDPNSGF